MPPGLPPLTGVGVGAPPRWVGAGWPPVVPGSDSCGGAGAAWRLPEWCWAWPWSAAGAGVEGSGSGLGAGSEVKSGGTPCMGGVWWLEVVVAAGPWAGPPARSPSDWRPLVGRSDPAWVGWSDPEWSSGSAPATTRPAIVLSGSTSDGEAIGFGGVMEVGAPGWRVTWLCTAARPGSGLPAWGAATLASGVFAAGALASDALGPFVVAPSLGGASVCFAWLLSGFIGPAALSGPC